MSLNVNALLPLVCLDQMDITGAQVRLLLLLSDCCCLVAVCAQNWFSCAHVSFPMKPLILVCLLGTEGHHRRPGLRPLRCGLVCESLCVLGTGWFCNNGSGCSIHRVESEGIWRAVNLLTAALSCVVAFAT
jgi:hypothetical protein